MLSNTAEYALRIVIALTEADSKSMTSEQIAKATSVPPDYAVKVLQWLGRAHLVKGRRGRGGGFWLNCDPQTTTLLDVVNTIDPLERIEECPLSRTDHKVEGLCPLHKCLDGIVALLIDSLQSLTLSGVVDGSDGPALCRHDDMLSIKIDGAPVE